MVTVESSQSEIRIIVEYAGSLTDLTRPQSPSLSLLVLVADAYT